MPRPLPIGLATGLLVLLLAPPVTGQERGDSPAEIRTVGTATRGVRPDLATLTLDFHGDGATPAEAGARVAALAEDLRRSFVALGIPRDSLATANRAWWWRPRMEVLLGPVRSVPPPSGSGGYLQVRDTIGYRAHDAIEVRIRDMRKVGAVIDAALALGLTGVSNVSFQATNTAGTRSELLRDATANARAQAQAVAEAAGLRLGRVKLLSTTDPAAGREYWDYSSIQVRGGSADAGTQVVEPNVQVNATVWAVWELLPAR